jgi:hypothetical protein
MSGVGSPPSPHGVSTDVVFISLVSFHTFCDPTGLRLGPHERTKRVRCKACRDVRCRNRNKPIDLNIRGTQALLDELHDVR